MIVIRTQGDGIEHLLSTLANGDPDYFAYSSSEATRIALAAAYAAGDYQPYTPPESIALPPEPNWDGFTGAIMADTALNQLMGAVLPLAPAVALGLPAALTQVATNGTHGFAQVWNAFCQIGQASQASRDSWAAMAEANNLPIDFVAVVSGNG